MASSKEKERRIAVFSLIMLIVFFFITNLFLVYLVYTHQNKEIMKLERKIIEFQSETQLKINTLSENIIETKSALEETISKLDLRIGSIGKEVSTLKASVSEDFSGIIEDAIKSVVTVRTDVSQGTGFIISNDGYIVTNAHVLVGGRKISIITYKGKIKNAEFIGYDRNLDIALLKVNGSYSKLELADSNNVQIGEKVIAIGNPLGLQFSVSQGIVSGVHRRGPNGLDAYIQTDAALNPGNSGGPLINKEGKVIGINNFKIGGGENLGFALESNYIKEAVNSISNAFLNTTLIK